MSQSKQLREWRKKDPDKFKQYSILARDFFRKVMLSEDFHIDPRVVKVYESGEVGKLTLNFFKDKQFRQQCAEVAYLGKDTSVLSV